MTRATLLPIAFACLIIGLGGPRDARARVGSPDVRAARAQAQHRLVRQRPRIRVTPAYPYRLYSTPYPTPYPYEYPGPGHVRECTSWLAQEARPSGTVIVPRMRCWWQPGQDGR